MAEYLTVSSDGQITLPAAIRRAAKLQEDDLLEVGWLRNELDDESLREWLISHDGRGLTLRPLRFWGLIYDLPLQQVNKWVQNVRSGVWAKG